MVLVILCWDSTCRVHMFLLGMDGCMARGQDGSRQGDMYNVMVVDWEKSLEQVLD